MNAQAVDVNLAALPPLGDGLLGELNRLRDFAPLHWSDTSRCWIVSGHAVVSEGLSGNLPLSSHHIPASLYRVVPPEEFEELAAMARAKGFGLVSATPLTRSSYHADSDFAALRAAREARMPVASAGHAVTGTAEAS